MTYAFQAEGLVKRFGETTALAGVDLAARPGTVLGVLGPNGAGKTTAVRILATLLRPDAGTARVAGFDVLRQAEQVRRRIGLTGQYASVDEDLTGTENLVMIGRLLDLSSADARARAAELLEWFDLTEAAGRRASTYSGGMRRRLDLAASLVAHPEVVYLDEPTTGLDPAKRDDVWAMVRRQVAEGVTVLLTTQYLEEADALADEIAVIDRGSVIAHGTPHELKAVVGGQTLQVRPLDPGRLADAAAVLERVAGQPATEPRRGVVSVPVDGDAALGAAVARLAQDAIQVTELSLRLPSLDEVFHTLTTTPTGAGMATERTVVRARAREEPLPGPADGRSDGVPETVPTSDRATPDAPNLDVGADGVPEPAPVARPSERRRGTPRDGAGADDRDNRASARSGGPPAAVRSGRPAARDPRPGASAVGSGPGDARAAEPGGPPPGGIGVTAPAREAADPAAAGPAGGAADTGWIPAAGSTAVGGQDRGAARLGVAGRAGEGVSAA